MGADVAGGSSARTNRTLGIVAIVMGVGVTLHQYNVTNAEEHQQLPGVRPLSPPTMVTIPDIRNQSLGQAIETLQAQHLLVVANGTTADHAIRYQNLNTIVNDESPVPGTSVSSDSYVVLKSATK
jgi:hypothetical protein